ncbi:predicted protein [Thalassiosira pseudonana CCMP1335]|uniref:Glycoside-hydrolase family GH114 TIM-barrel domain-containing protein n=1 Tax=Thalassiosira pseudonana TaxID=35128 RepID=B5YNN8_THAPS|nr:predicted protein [Thalassiosira pseudonana CCMP1335]ACI65020.1 predicted protein [Thalassiosira pseudonana CCMP1335]
MESRSNPLALIICHNMSKMDANDEDEMKIFDDGEEDPLGKDTSILPEWSWGRVRPWVPIRRGENTVLMLTCILLTCILLVLYSLTLNHQRSPITADAFDDEQIRQVAGHDVVMLEKANGFKTFGSTEEGTLIAAKRIKAINSSCRVLFYLNSMIHYPYYASNETFNEERWAMRNPKTDDHFKWFGRFLSYDHRNLEFREWWIKRALDMLQHDEIDGVFIDAIIKTHTIESRVDGAEGHAAAYIETANELRARLPVGKLLIGNALRATSKGGVGGDGNLKHLRYLDGSYLENWDKSDEGIVKTIKLMDTALKAGRIVMLTSTPFSGYGVDEKQYPQKQQDIVAKLKEIRRDETIGKKYEYMAQFIEFPLGLFLLSVGRHSYFSYHDKDDADPKLKAAFDCNQFEEITRKLGQPLGDCVEEGEFTFTRLFTHLKVWVNVKRKEGKLTVRPIRREDES